MIKFFRKIRRKLIDEGNLKKYLIYAVGEIVLVVIGILIALQVNNWSLNKKEKEDERKTLIELKEGFKLDLEDLAFNKDIMRGATNSCAILIRHIDNQLPFHDSLKVHFARSIANTRFVSNSGPYETLKTKGIELISNDTLRHQIVKMHDFHFEAMKTFETGETLSDKYWIEFCMKHFDVVQMITINKQNEISEGKMTPLNYEGLISNTEYLTLLKTIKNQNEVSVKSRIEVICKKLEALIESIDTEIN